LPDHLQEAKRLNPLAGRTSSADANPAA
jgi:hypothetical protein